MTKRKLIDVEMEQTGEALTSPSYRARQANSDTAKRRGAMSSILSKVGGISQFNPYPQSSTKNPATGQSWFETPSAEYQAWEDKNRRLDLEDRKATDNQTIDFNLNFLNKVRTKANDEINRSLGNELQIRNKALGDELAARLPYNAYQNDSNRFKGAETLSSTLPGVLSALKYSNNNVSVSF